MATIPDSTRCFLTLQLTTRAHDRWPDIHRVITRFRNPFAYIDAELTDGTILKLCRLRYTGYANAWGFAIWRASHDDYQDSWLPTGHPSGTPEDALDTACGLYLRDPTAWTTPPPTNS